MPLGAPMSLWSALLRLAEYGLLYLVYSMNFIVLKWQQFLLRHMLLQVAALFQSVLAVRSKRVVKLVCRGSVNLPHSEYMHML